MKFLNHNLFTGDITVNGTTTLSTATGVTRATGDNTTHLATTAFVKAQDYATNTALGNYVPISRTLTINGVTYDLSANRSWTIGTADYTSTVKHIVKAGVAITKGQAVYVTSSDGTNMIVGLASNTSEATSSKTMGLVDTTVSANGFTSVITEGLLAGLDTSTAAAGDPVWLGANGNLIFGLLNKPISPLHLVYIGVVTRVQQNNGEIFVKVQNGIEIDEVHDIQISLPATGQLLRRDTDGYWKNWTPNFLVPSNVSGTTNYVSKFTGTNTLGNSLIYDNGTGVGIGTTDITAGLHVNYSAANTLLLQRISDDSGPPEAIGRKARGTLNAKTGVTANDRLWFFAAAGYIGTEGVDGAWSSNKVGMNFVASENWTSAAQGTHITWATTEIGQTTRTDKMILTGAGNLGIGTASPSYKLQVNAAGEGLYVIGANTAPYTQTIASFVYGGNSNSINIENQAGKASIQARAGASTMDLLLNPVAGNVGIGIGSPSNKLQVANGDMSITSGYSFILADTDTNWRLGRNIITPVESVYLNSNTFEFVAANASDQGWQFINDDGYPVLEIGAATGSRNVWVNAGNLLVPTGSVGIGTASPLFNLQVGANAGTVAATTIRLQNSYLDTNGSYGFNIDAVDNGVSGHDLRFLGRSSPTGGFSELVRVKNTGNVGIGTNSPSHKLTVAGGSVLMFPSDNTRQLSFFNDSYGITASSGLELITGDYIRFRQSSTELARLTTTGFGIGTTSPSTTLDVLGKIKLGLDGTYGGSDYVTIGFGGTSNGYNRVFGYNGTSDGLYLTSATGHGISFRTNGGSTDNMFINSAGNVGIGTTSPLQKLDVNGNISLGSWTKPGSTYVGLRRADDGSFGGGGDSGLVIESYNHAAPYTGDYSQRVHLRTHLYNGGSHNVLTAYGTNVGVGIDTPTEKLHVVGRARITTIDNGTGDFATISGTGVITRRTAAQVLSDIGAQPSGSYLTAEADTLATVTGRGASTSTAVTFNGGATISGIGGDGSEVLRLTGSASDAFNYATASVWGNLTAGETVAHVIGKAESQYNTANFGYRHVADGSPSNHVTIGMFQADNLLNILGNGNVGIGTASPIYKLQVAGSTYVNGGTLFIDSGQYLRWNLCRWTHLLSWS